MGIKEIVKVVIDTNTLIYYFENHQDYAQNLERLFTQIEDGEICANISILSVLEILVKPKRDKNDILENKYKTILYNYPNLSIINLDMKIIDIAASLRANYSIKTPDSIIVSTAIATNSKYLISNDIRLKSTCENLGIYFTDLKELNHKEGYFYST